MQGLQLVRIPDKEYSDFRYRVIFEGYKWDPQVGDINTVARDTVVLDSAVARQLAYYAEALAQETLELESALLSRPDLYSKLDLPRPLRKALKCVTNHNHQAHVRLMRFDFHPTASGWAVSEVNSDVPGGFAEAGLLPYIASQYVQGTSPRGDLAGSLTTAFSSLLATKGTIAFVHATAYSDDRQVMGFMSSRFQRAGFRTALIAPDHIPWEGKKAVCIAEGQEGPVHGLMRFFPAEWLCDLPRHARWQGYFTGSIASCNHPTAILTQSKRLPLLWEELNVPVPAWQELLPETRDPRQADWSKGNWVLKPAFGRVGEDITIKEVITPKEWRSISWSARLYPGSWVAQRRFSSEPLLSQEGPQHLCIGVFTVQGKFAGFYGRMSRQPRIDANAQDVAVLVAEKGGN